MNASPRLTRGIMYDRYAHAAHRVPVQVWLDVFQAIYNTLERQPTISLSEVAPKILDQLNKK